MEKMKPLVHGLSITSSSPLLSTKALVKLRYVLCTLANDLEH